MLIGLIVLQRKNEGSIDMKQFTMSMYINKEELYKAKAEYYQSEYERLHRALDKMWNVQMDSDKDEIERDVETYSLLRSLGYEGC